MTKEEIQEGNKLIAEFDGWKVEPFDIDANELNILNDEDWLVLNQYDSDGKRIRQIDGWECANISSDELETLPYATNWNWLMPVVEKIESMSTENQWFDVTIKGGFCSIDRSWTGLHGDSSESIAFFFNGDKRHNTYKAVIEFIQWHTTNQQQEEGK